MKGRKECGIKIRKNGPYVVTGDVHLSEKIIVPKGRGYELKDGRELPQAVGETAPRGTTFSAEDWEEF